MGELQIEELAKTRLYTENIRITAPSAGFILSRNISPGQRFDKGYEWYRLADLSRIWILTDTYEKETKHLPPGKIVRVSHRDREDPPSPRERDVAAIRSSQPDVECPAGDGEP